MIPFAVKRTGASPQTIRIMSHLFNEDERMFVAHMRAAAGLTDRPGLDLYIAGHARRSPDLSPDAALMMWRNGEADVLITQEPLEDLQPTKVYDAGVFFKRWRYDR